jgi:poly(ADP-ribose) glycohydrolase ARH3
VTEGPPPPRGVRGDDRRIDAYRGALVGVAVGDGRGAPFEGRPGLIASEEIHQTTRTGPLPTTDDTAMTVAVAESLLHRGGLDEDHLAATFATSFARDPHRGYGAGTAALLQRIAAGDDWRAAAVAQFGGQGSYGNGAAMRSAPFGVLAAGYPQEAAGLARRAARITHTHPLGVEGAAAVAAAVSLLVAAPGGEPIDGSRLAAAVGRVLSDGDMRAALDTSADLARVATPVEIVRTLGNGVAALEAVPAAFCAFLRHPGSFSDAVDFAISLGGDTDTMACMTGALAGAYLGFSAVPDDWVERTEEAGKLGMLADRFARRHANAS